MPEITIMINKVKVAEVFQWIKLSFNCFLKHPFLFILFSLIYVLMNIIVQFVPILVVIDYILVVFFIGSFVSVAKKISQGEIIEFRTFFQGFFTKRLLFLGIILTLGFFVAVTIPLLLSYVIYGDLEYHPALVVLMLVLIVLWGLAFMFSPAICKLNPQIGALTAIKLSYSGAFKNILVIFVCGILAVLITLFALIPLGLGLLVSVSVLNMTTYFAYQSIFTIRVISDKC